MSDSGTDKVGRRVSSVTTNTLTAMTVASRWFCCANFTPSHLLLEKLRHGEVGNVPQVPHRSCGLAASVQRSGLEAEFQGISRKPAFQTLCSLRHRLWPATALFAQQLFPSGGGSRCEERGGREQVPVIITRPGYPGRLFCKSCV